MNPEESARTVLTKVWLDRGFPVDPVWIANELGIRVLEGSLPSKISGALVKKLNEDPVILLNKMDSKNRKRFTCAHEIGHYIARQNNNDDSYEFIDMRSPRSSEGIDQEEVFANGFAANLLMPRDELLECKKKNTQAFAAAYYFGVSQEAYNNRLANVRG